MSVRWERFSGDTSQFAVELAFHADPDDGQAVDPDVASSWGSLQIWAAGINLCSHVDQGEMLQASHWYLLPILEWLAESWDPLLHEERLPSPRLDMAADLATVTPAILSDPEDSRALAMDEHRYRWEQRHSLRTAREGGLLPGVHLRRLRDQIEISWNNPPVAGAADAEFVATMGRSLQDPSDVAIALFEVLKDSVAWLQRQRPASERLRKLVETIAQLHGAGRTDERTAWLAGMGGDRTEMIDRWHAVVGQARTLAGAGAFEGTFGLANERPLVIAGSCEASLLFGSASPDIDVDDAMELARLLLEQYDPSSHDGLADLVQDEPVDADLPAWEHGYELADMVLDEVGPELLSDRTEIETFLDQRRTKLKELSLSDRLIRAVSFAGPNHAPTIALNRSSSSFEFASARRFTLAHELCHLLFDRTRGARLAVASGPWAPSTIEKRANAFASRLLMPPVVLAGAVRSAPDSIATPEGAKGIASRIGVSVTALVAHSYNVGLIDEAAREDLRLAFEPPQ